MQNPTPKVSIITSSRAQPDRSIETLRGLAIILLVTHHASFAADEWIQQLSYALVYLRMPLFTAISGYVYAMRRVESGEGFKFLFKKARRILVPSFAILSIWLLLNLIFDREWAIQLNTKSFKDILLFYFHRPRTYWFVQALFIIFLITVAVERMKLLDRISLWLLIFIASAAFAGASYHYEEFFVLTSWFSFRGAIYLLPFFLLGFGLNLFSNTLFRPTTMIVITVFLLSGVLLMFAHRFGYLVLETNRAGYIGLILSCTFVYMAFCLRRPIYLLPKIGFYAFPIYLYHRFAMEAVESLSWPSGQLLKFIALVGFGILIPMLLHKWLYKHRIPALIFLGETRKVITKKNHTRAD